MPQLIKDIDAIARNKQRDALFIRFAPVNIVEAMLEYNHRKDKRRKKVLAWLNKNRIAWQECVPMTSDNCSCSYIGDVYLDVPYDESDPQYQLVMNYLENPDGSLRDENVHFCYVSLENAMKNAHHDEPGFWERWAPHF